MAGTASPMLLIAWKDDYCLGIEKVDGQHRSLFGLLNDLFVAVQQDRGPRLVRDTLTRLVEYTQTHFADEEQFMAHIQYPGLEGHRASHRRLVKRVAGFAVGYRQGPGKDLAMELLHFLRDWLKNHILNEDMKIASFQSAR